MFVISRFECTCTYTEKTKIIFAILNRSTFKFAYLAERTSCLKRAFLDVKYTNSLTHTKEVSILTKIFSIYFFFCKSINLLLSLAILTAFCISAAMASGTKTCSSSLLFRRSSSRFRNWSAEMVKIKIKITNQDNNFTRKKNHFFVKLIYYLTYFFGIFFIFYIYNF